MIIFIEKTLFYGLLIFILALGLMSCSVPLRNIDTNGYYYQSSRAAAPVDCVRVSSSLTKCKSR
jgi:hypothetical protein